MNLCVFSDLHLEMDAQQGRKFMGRMDPMDVDVLILAGDITICRHLPYVIRTICEIHEGKPVLFVNGNHEHYLSSREAVAVTLTQLELEHSNFHWLENKVFEWQGKTFAGTTLWFPEDPLNALYKSMLNDFVHIKNFESWVYDTNRKAKAFLESVLPVDVVITHHSPCSMSINDRFRGHNLNRFYVSDLSELILDKGPAYWFHGHLHNPVDYLLGDTRVYSNPKGYPQDPSQGYRGKHLLTL